MKVLKKITKKERNHKVVNFDIMHHQCSRKKIEKSIKDHQAIYNYNFKSHPTKEKQKVISSACYVKQNDSFLDKKVAKQF